MTDRTPREVLEDHLQKAREGKFEEDFALNFQPDCLHLTNYGVFRGIEGARRMFEILSDDLPEGVYDYETVLVEDGVGFLVWSGTSPSARVPWGTDTYVFRDGKIAVMTFHYAVEPLE